MSLPLPTLAKRPEIERFVKNEWKEALLGAATSIDKKRNVIKKATELTGEQAVVGATTVGSSLLTAGVGALAGTAGIAAIASLSGASALTTSAPLLVPLVLLGVAWSLYLRPGAKQKAGKNIANGLIGALSEGAGSTDPPDTIPFLPPDVGT